MQLDGELQGRAHLAPGAKVAIPGGAAIEVPAGLKAGANGKVYSSAFDCLRKTWANEGLGGIQRGLGAAVRFFLCLYNTSLPSFLPVLPYSRFLCSQYTYQIALNGSRLGFFEPLRQNINALVGYQRHEIHGWTSIAAGASSGVVGGTSYSSSSSLSTELNCSLSQPSSETPSSSSKPVCKPSPLSTPSAHSTTTLPRSTVCEQSSRLTAPRVSLAVSTLRCSERRWDPPSNYQHTVLRRVNCRAGVLETTSGCT